MIFNAIYIVVFIASMSMIAIGCSQKGMKKSDDVANEIEQPSNAIDHSKGLATEPNYTKGIKAGKFNFITQTLVASDSLHWVVKDSGTVEQYLKDGIITYQLEPINSYWKIQWDRRYKVSVEVNGVSETLSGDILVKDDICLFKHRYSEIWHELVFLDSNMEARYHVRFTPATEDWLPMVNHIGIPNKFQERIIDTGTIVFTESIESYVKLLRYCEQLDTSKPVGIANYKERVPEWLPVWFNYSRHVNTVPVKYNHQPNDSILDLTSN